MKTTIFNISLAVIITTSSFMLGRMETKNEIPTQQVSQEINLEEQPTNTAIYTRATIINGEMLPVVDLPELTISADRPEQNIVHATILDGEVIPYVNLPEVKIEA